VEEHLRLLEGVVLFTLNTAGEVTERWGDETALSCGISFLDAVVESDKKRAATLVMDAVIDGHGQGNLRLMADNDYRIYAVTLAGCDDKIIGSARRVRDETPSFTTDFFGNVLEFQADWECLAGVNLLNVVEDQRRFMEILRTAVTTGSYEGPIAINECEYALRIKATTSLEFFIEEDVHRLIRAVLDARDVREIAEKTCAALAARQVPFSLKLYGETCGTEKRDCLGLFPLYRRGERIGEIRVYEPLEPVEYHMVKCVSIAASKAVEQLERLDEMLQDVALFKIDVERRIVFANKKFEEVTGMHAADITGKPLDEFAAHRETFFKNLKKNGAVQTTTAWHIGESERIMQEFARRINGETLIMMLDLTDQKEREAEVEFYNAVLRHDIFNKNEIALGYLGLLERTNLTKKQKEMAEKIGDALQTANDLIANVRKANEIGKTDGQLEPVNVREVIEEVCKSYEHLVKENNVTVTCEIAEGEIEADAFVCDVFSNIVKNALEHAACSKLVIAGKETDGRYTVEISDNGKGIASEHADKIFEKGWKRGGSGSGLGLYIVKRLMERYDGSVSVKSKDGKGSTFILSFKTPDTRPPPQLVKIRI
jgi:PAS domain S-box-containing protein